MNKKKILLTGLGAAMLADAFRAAQMAKIIALTDDLYKAKGSSVMPDGKYEIPADKSEIHAPAEQAYKYDGQMSVPIGAKLWDWDFNLDTLEEVKTTGSVVIDEKGNKITRKEAQRGDNSVYIVAINRKNALRKVEKLKKAYIIATSSTKID